MNLKVVSCCVCCLFWAFFIPQTQTFRHEDMDWVDVKNAAIWSTSIFEENKELIRSAPKIYKFIKLLATDIKSFVGTVNPAYAAATVYFTAVVAVSYHFSVEANQQLLKAKFKKDNLKLIINTKIIPILELLERLQSEGDMETFCKAKSKIQEQCENALTSLQNVRKDIEQQMLDSVSGIGKNKVLQWLTGAGGLAGIGIGVMGMNPPAIAFGLSALVSGFVGVGVGYNNIRSYEDAMSHLEEAMLEIVEIETTFGKALTKADIFCAIFPSFQEVLNSLEDLKLATTRLQSKKSKLVLRNEL